MKKFVLLLLISFPALVYAQPSIVFESVAYDFGKVEQGVSLEYAFEFMNTGTEDLLILGLKPS
jgi:hypothetical protein